MNILAVSELGLCHFFTLGVSVYTFKWNTYFSQCVGTIFSHNFISLIITEHYELDIIIIISVKFLENN